MKCWAKSEGDCDGKSLEHYISQSLFSSNKVRVKGFSWCKDEDKEVGLASLGRNILCSKHNSQLSELDSAAKVMMDSMRYAADLGKERMSMKPRKWSVHKKNVSGKLIERWFIKTLINITYEHHEKYILPVDKLCSLAFGKTPIIKPQGLYMSASLGDEIRIEETFSVAPIWKDSEIIVGGVFKFSGFSYIIAFSDIIPFINDNGGMYRLKRYKFMAHGRESLHILFNW